MDFGLIIIGNELLSGKRQDAHLGACIERLKQRRHRVAWVRVVGDGKELLLETLRQTRAHGGPVLVFGGIGATPDDLTRASAATAFDRALEQNESAATILRNAYGERAHPQRILMADLPAGCDLIENPVGTAPGFSVEQHHFFPGFPEMAWPMVDDVLDRLYPLDATTPEIAEYRLLVRGTTEGDLVPLMEQTMATHPDIDLSSLPQMAKRENGKLRAVVEFGFRGPEPSAARAIETFESGLAEIEYERLPTLR